MRKIQNIKVSEVVFDLTKLQSEDRCSAERAHTIADNFDWALFDAVSANRREDGSLVVWDGWHRVKAFEILGYPLIPCRVSEGLKLLDEAGHMLDKDASTVKFGALNRFRLACTAERKPQIDIAAFLKNLDCGVGKGAFDLSFPDTLIEYWLSRRECTESALECCADLARSRHKVTGSVFKGIFWLYSGGVDVLTYLDKIKLEGGVPAIRKAAHAVKKDLGLFAGLSGATGAVYGRAILNVINDGRRRKVTLVRTPENDKTIAVSEAMGED